MFMTLTVMVMLGSSFFTDIIGVHPIFGTALYSLRVTRILMICLLMIYHVVGAFLTGLIVPREGGLTIALTEKLEDMVTIIFLPLVRTSSISFAFVV